LPRLFSVGDRGSTAGSLGGFLNRISSPAGAFSGNVGSPHTNFPACIRKVKKAGGKRAGSGTFQNGECTACAAPGAAYAAGVKQKNPAHGSTTRNVGMTKKRCFRPRIPGSGGYGATAFFHTVAVSVRQKELSGRKPGIFPGYFQHPAVANGRPVIPVAPDSVPGKGKTRTGGCRSQVLVAIPQKDRHVKDTIRTARPFKRCRQVCYAAMGIRDNQNKSAFR